MHLFYTPELKKGTSIYTLSEEESKHCIRVLRMTVGDKIQLVNGVGGFYVAEIIDNNPKKCSVKIVDEKLEVGKRNWKLHIVIAPTKNNDRTEWFVEKATEIGIDAISFIDTKNSERSVIKKERIEKVAVSAMKQSLKAYLPQLNEMTDFKKIIDALKNDSSQKYIAHCIDTEKKHLKEVYRQSQDAIVLIGPEGDFSSDEVQLAVANGFVPVSLGNSRLRTETAALYACTVLNVLNE
jgi:16S rRNA (uracil1498-N3)-methyltransferase